MKLPRDISGNELANALSKHWGYARIHQIGSHIVLQCEEPEPHRISIPAHRSLRVGTLSAILRSVATHKKVSRDEIIASL